jgi:tRNA nucleotidyltransferase (CCA-adding enzyme)
MLSTQDAFRKFRSKLELNTKEQEDASRRQKEVRGVMDDAFEIDHDFLTGSYARWTKTKPLKDVDIFCVLAKKHRDYRDKLPSVLLADVEKALVKKYGKANVSQQRRSCTVQFGVKPVEDLTDYKVMGFDVVPAFAKNNHYEIPDTETSSGWTENQSKIITTRRSKPKSLR